MKNARTIVTGSVLGLGLLAGALAVAQQGKDKQPEMQLPPGWTTEDMQACMMAGTPGKQHEQLAKMVGKWNAHNKMWMGPGGQEMASEGTWTVTSIMDGRYVRTDVSGEVPGMGAFSGMGIAGFDNVSQQYVADWIDSHSSGIMRGTGEMSPDGKTMTWRYTYNCPITKKPTVMREILRWTGDNTMTMEMHMTDPKSNKEYKGMEINLTRAK
ncbi:MAG TPA: DUF1579 domain-containing protein [Phycisphaerales bacterium]|nr:DUF1579 domain-containing protein [Phycisphaerales bacterium]